MTSIRVLATGALLACTGIGMFMSPTPAAAESYVAGVAGVNFADRLTNVNGTNDAAGIQFEDLDLQNSLSLGAKVGYFPQHRWLGVEGEVLHTTPHIKSLESDPGIHLRLTSVLINLLARYPGRTFQPYAGVGVGMVIARVGATATSLSDTDVAAGWNAFAGLRAFVTPNIALFTEYKYMASTLQFDQAFSATGGFEGTYRAQHVLFGLSYHF